MQRFCRKPDRNQDRLWPKLGRPQPCTKIMRVLKRKGYTPGIPEIKIKMLWGKQKGRCQYLGEVLYCKWKIGPGLQWLFMTYTPFW